MSREEAIKVLKMVEAHGLAEEAKQMAIQALSQEPCRVKNELNVELNELKPGTDAVSREAVLSIIDGWYEQNRETENIEDLIILITYMDSVTPKARECEDVISREAVMGLVAREHTEWDDLYIDIAKLPSVTQKSGMWISVSERLPEDKTYVLTTIKVPNRVAHARSGWYQSGYFHNDNGDTWKATDIEVKAWMPLPKPYEPKGSEDKE